MQLLQRSRQPSLIVQRTVTIKAYLMNLFLSIGPIAALVAGVLILVMPRLLNYIVAVYLILIGLVGLFGGGIHIR